MGVTVIADQVSLFIHFFQHFGVGGNSSGPSSKVSAIFFSSVFAERIGLR